MVGKPATPKSLPLDQAYIIYERKSVAYKNYVRLTLLILDILIPSGISSPAL